jgi:hypothetical protein
MSAMLKDRDRLRLDESKKSGRSQTSPNNSILLMAYDLFFYASL